MAFVAKLRSYFYTTLPINNNGKETGFKTDGQPNQERFEEFMGSTAFKAEGDDRAKIDVALGDIEDQAGLVAVVTDAEVLTYTDGLKADRTLVPTAKNLTEVATSAVNDNIPLTNGVPEFDDTIVTMTKDGTETKRNKFFPQIKATFITWLTANVLPRLLPVISGGDASKIVSVNVGETAYELVVPTPSSGLPSGGTVGQIIDNTAPATGQWVDMNTKAIVSVVDTATPVNAIIKSVASGIVTLFGLDASGYVTISSDANKHTYTFDTAGFLAGEITPTWLVKNASSIGGGQDILKGVTGGGVAEVYSLTSSDTSVGIAVTTNDIDLTVNDAYINNLISLHPDVGGGGAETGIPYLFHATKLTAQTGALLAVDTKITFRDDESVGNFDNGDSWSVSQWTANDTVVADNTKLEFNLVIGYSVSATTVGASIDLDLIQEVGGVPAIIGTVNLDANQAIASYNAVINNAVTTTIVADDNVYLKVKTITNNGDAYITINAGSTIYNVTTV